MTSIVAPDDAQTCRCIRCMMLNDAQNLICIRCMMLNDAQNLICIRCMMLNDAWHLKCIRCMMPGRSSASCDASNARIASCVLWAPALFIISKKI